MLLVYIRSHIWSIFHITLYFEKLLQWFSLLLSNTNSKYEHEYEDASHI